MVLLLEFRKTDATRVPYSGILTRIPAFGIRGAKYESFRKLGVPYFGVLIISMLLLRVLYQEDPQASENV